LAAGTVAVLGNERAGLSHEVQVACDVLLSISGSGTLDSLNVSVAAGIVAHALAMR
jgi:TrmH RNA methyltransferase